MCVFVYCEEALPGTGDYGPVLPSVRRRRRSEKRGKETSRAEKTREEGTKDKRTTEKATRPDHQQSPQLRRARVTDGHRGAKARQRRHGNERRRRGGKGGKPEVGQGVLGADAQVEARAGEGARG